MNKTVEGQGKAVSKTMECQGKAVNKTGERSRKGSEQDGERPGKGRHVMRCPSTLPEADTWKSNSKFRFPESSLKDPQSAISRPKTETRER